MTEEQEQKKENELEEIAVEQNLDEIMLRVLPTGAQALKPGPIFERQKHTFVMDAGTCVPEAFTGPFRLTVVALTHQEEIEVTRTIKAPTDLPFTLAKKALYAFNGRTLNDKSKNFLFEALGPRGRQVVVLAYGEINSAGDEALGKMQSELEVL